MKLWRQISCVFIVMLFGCHKPPSPTVYIQEGDTFYHRAKCECLTGNEQAFPLSSVKKEGYKPCLICELNWTK
jgi:hypothetical protein